MKKLKILFIVIGLGFSMQLYSQEYIAPKAKEKKVKRKLGVGVQTSLSLLGVSVKYDVYKNSVVQAVIGPFKTGNVNLDFYGGRYLYRFIIKEKQRIAPYVFASLG